MLVIKHWWVNVFYATLIKPLITQSDDAIEIKIRNRAQRCPLGFHEFPSRLCKQWDNGTISHPSLLASIYYIISQSLCTLQSNLSNNRCHIQKSAHLFHAVPMTTQCPQITAPSEDIHHSAESSNQSLDDN